MSNTIRKGNPQQRSRTDPLHAWHDYSNQEPVSVTIVTAVAKSKGVDVTDLPPLYHRIDPDALDRLVRRQEDLTPRFQGYIRFEYAGQSVTVFGDGEITVQPQTGD